LLLKVPGNQIRIVYWFDDVADCFGDSIYYLVYGIIRDGLEKASEARARHWKSESFGSKTLGRILFSNFICVDKKKFSFAKMIL
jgi:hypothetical protein